MKKNGFTLIELLAVLIILMLILAISVPNLMNVLNTNKQKVYDDQVKEIERLARQYVIDNTDVYNTIDEVGYINVTLETLCTNNYLECPVKDPRTKTVMTGSVKITSSNGDYIYEFQSTGSEEHNTLTVTFDPNGGIVTRTKKEVIQGNIYGVLPTPTREGYRFLGWNGKNILNLNKYKVTLPWLEITDETITVHKSNTHVSHAGPYVDGLVGGTKYTISANIQGNFSNRIYAFFGGSFYSSYGNKQTFTYASTDDKGRLYIEQANNPSRNTDMDLTSNSVIFSNIMLVEGENAAPYEPYFITGSTRVVQSSNHTLKAIWEEI